MEAGKAVQSKAQNRLVRQMKLGGREFILNGVIQDVIVKLGLVNSYDVEDVIQVLIYACLIGSYPPLWPEYSFSRVNNHLQKRFNTQHHEIITDKSAFWAKVGDDVYGDDPTVNKLESTAKDLGTATQLIKTLQLPIIVIFRQSRSSSPISIYSVSLSSLPEVKSTT